MYNFLLLLRFFMCLMRAAGFTKLFEFQFFLNCFLVARGVVIDFLALIALQFY